MRYQLDLAKLKVFSVVLNLYYIAMLNTKIGYFRPVSLSVKMDGKRKTVITLKYYSYGILHRKSVKLSEQMYFEAFLAVFNDEIKNGCVSGNKTSVKHLIEKGSKCSKKILYDKYHELELEHIFFKGLNDIISKLDEGVVWNFKNLHILYDESRNVTIFKYFNNSDLYCYEVDGSYLFEFESLVKIFEANSDLSDNYSWKNQRKIIYEKANSYDEEAFDNIGGFENEFNELQSSIQNLKKALSLQS